MEIGGIVNALRPADRDICVLVGRHSLLWLRGPNGAVLLVIEIGGIVNALRPVNALRLRDRVEVGERHCHLGSLQSSTNFRTMPVVVVVGNWHPPSLGQHLQLFFARAKQAFFLSNLLPSQIFSSLSLNRLILSLSTWRDCASLASLDFILKVEEDIFVDRAISTAAIVVAFLFFSKHFSCDFALAFRTFSLSFFAR